MELNRRTAELICEIEHIIGGQCLNPNSFDSWNGVHGRRYRYPVCVSTKRDGKFFKYNTRSIVMVDNPDDVRTMEYKFGSNHLQIGLAIIDALEHIEKEYGVSFNAKAE